jgi:hypothetical protein
VFWKTHPAADSPAVISGSVPLTGATWKPAESMPGVFVTELPADFEVSSSSSNVSFRSIYVSGQRYWPARYPNNPDPSRLLYPFGYTFNGTWGAAMKASDGHSLSGGKKVTLCQHDSPFVAGVNCSRPHTSFPASPWQVREYC